MDSDLVDRLKKIKMQIELLYAAEEVYLTLDAVKDHKLATLMFTSMENSVAAKQVSAHRTEDWHEFKKALAIAEAKFHKEKHMLDLQNSTFQAQYLSAKIEVDLVRNKKD